MKTFFGLSDTGTRTGTGTGTRLTLLMVGSSIFVFGLVAQATAADASKVKTKAGETVDAAVEYTQQTRDEFQQEMKKNLTTLEEDIADLKAQAGAATGDFRKRLARQIDALEVKRDVMRKDLIKMTEASGRAWTRMKVGLERAWTDVKTAYNKAANEFDDQSSSNSKKETESKRHE